MLYFLSNLYLSNIDNFMFDLLKSTTKLKNNFKKKCNPIEFNTKNNIYSMNSIRSQEIFYVRYLNSFFIGVRGQRVFVTKIKTVINNFMKINFFLMNSNKKLIFKNYEAIPFVNHIIHKILFNRKTISSDRNKQRFLKLQLKTFNRLTRLNEKLVKIIYYKIRNSITKNQKNSLQLNNRFLFNLIKLASLKKIKFQQNFALKNGITIYINKFLKNVSFIKNNFIKNFNLASKFLKINKSRIQKFNYLKNKLLQSLKLVLVTKFKKPSNESPILKTNLSVKNFYFNKISSVSNSVNNNLIALNSISIRFFAPITIIYINLQKLGYLKKRRPCLNYNFLE